MAVVNYHTEGELLVVGVYSSYKSKLSTKEVDILQEVLGFKKIRIQGLNQELFDYFIDNYAIEFESIFLHQCPRISDFSGFEKLSKIREIRIFWNQKATSFWDFNKNKLLTRFQFDDCLKITKLDELVFAQSLEYLEFGDAIHSKLGIQSLKPLKALGNLKTLAYNFKRIEDNDIADLADMTNLDEIRFPLGSYTTEEVAWLKAHLKGKAKERMYDAYVASAPFNDKEKGKVLDTFIVGKKKPWLSSKDDADRIEKYVKSYLEMVKWFETYPNKRPEEYKKLNN